MQDEQSKRGELNEDEVDDRTIEKQAERGELNEDEVADHTIEKEGKSGELNDDKVSNHRVEKSKNLPRRTRKQRFQGMKEKMKNAKKNFSRMIKVESLPTSSNEGVDEDLEESETAQFDQIMTENRGILGGMTSAAIVAETSPSTTGPMPPTTRVIKVSEEVGSKKPGAYRMNNPMAGLTPAWIRNRNQRQFLISSIFGQNQNQTNDQSHLPPEMRNVNHTNDQSHLPPEMGFTSPNRSRVDAESQHAPELFHTDGSHAITQAEVLRYSQYLREKSRRLKMWIFLGLVVLIGAGIGLGVGFFGNSGGDEKIESSNENNLEAYACQYADFEDIFMARKQCVCDGGIEGIPENHITQYNTLKEYLFGHNAIPDFDYNVPSCEISNLALHWLVEDTLKGGEELDNNLLNRYALAACFLSWTKNNPTSQWKNQLRWMSRNSVCSWFGITCNDSGDITGIELKYNRLKGSIPSQLTLLSQLVNLDVGSNTITGSIPTEVGRLSNLASFSIWGNEISGRIPTEIGQMSFLHRLELYSNNLIGNVPSEIGYLNSLKQMRCASNELTGEVPSEIALLENIEEIDCSHNMFSGKLSTTIGLLSELRILSLSQNKITGTIPSEIGLLSNIEELWFENNMFVGRLPTTIGLCSGLRKLFLAQNKMTGTIPSEIGLLSKIEEIDFHWNRYVGSIPSTIGKLRNLKLLVFSDNKMTGSIPSAFGACNSLTNLDLGANSFTGSIPTEIGSLQALQEFSIGSNNFSGSIPTYLGACQHLTNLDISHNRRIKGAMPLELGKLSSLQNFYFDSTGLTGTVPGQMCTLLENNLKILCVNPPSFIQCNCCTQC